MYLQGNSAGIEPSAWESLRRTKVFFKAPITTPQGGGFKSLNVTTRKMLGLYANVRPCVAYSSLRGHEASGDGRGDCSRKRRRRLRRHGVSPDAGHDAVPEADQPRPGCETIVRYAFEYARKNDRKKVTCFTKDNIMKITDGLFHKVFDEIAAEYSDIVNEHWIVDIGAAKLADTPEAFDVIVMPNLYGDVLSDVAAQIAGSVGLAGSANIGVHYAMFEAIHGSAPRRAGQNLANPSGLLLGGVMMLVHIGQEDIAERVHNAWLKTIEDGIHTYDIYEEGTSKQKVGTKEFAAGRRRPPGAEAGEVEAAVYKAGPRQSVEQFASQAGQAEEGDGGRRPGDRLDRRHRRCAWTADREAVGRRTQADHDCESRHEGLSGWIRRYVLTERFVDLPLHVGDDGGAVSHDQVIALLKRATDAGFDFVKTEGLHTFDGKPGFSLAKASKPH